MNIEQQKTDTKTTRATKAKSRKAGVIRQLENMNKAEYVPANDDPRVELRRLTQEHVAMVRASVSFNSMASTKTRRIDLVNKETGEVVADKGAEIPCRLPLEVQDYIKGATASFMGKQTDALEKQMAKQLKLCPLYTHFLKHIRGCGPVVSSYLIAHIDFEVATKPSAVRRFCGLGVTDSKADRRTKGQKLCYNQELKTRLWQFMAMGRMGRRHGLSKYLKIWDEKKASLIAMRGPGTPDNKSNGWCDDTGRRKATDVFLEDLYIMGRTLQGLPVWPSWYAKAMGYEHGGKIAVLQPKLLTLDEALKIVGISEIKADSAQEDDADSEGVELVAAE